MATGLATGHARSLLLALATGEPTASWIDAMAEAVLNDELVQLALRVAQGGEQRARSAIELAAMLVAREQARAATTDSEETHSRAK